MNEIPKRPKKAVVDGKPTYTSASSLQTADHNTGGGCGRKWWFQKVMGLRTESTKSQAMGTKTHGLIEHYLNTGELTLNSIAMAGKHFIPPRDPRQMIEHRIWDQQISPAGIPMEGFIDLVQPRELSEEGVAEVIDWKTTGNIKYAKSGQDLTKTIQMMSYGKWAIEYFKVDRVRLTHVYFQTKGRPQSIRSTILVGEDQINKKWESIEKVAGTLYELAGATDVKDVPANRDSCDAFGGCPFFSQCPRSVGETLNMSLLSDTPDPVVPNEFADAWDNIVLAGRGLPPISAKVAAMVAVMDGGSSTQRDGEGELGGLPDIHHPDTIILLSKELGESDAKVAPPVVVAPQVLPPDAPKSAPEKAALPIPKELPKGILTMAEAKKLKKGDLLESYNVCFDALLERLDDATGLQSGVAIQEQKPPQSPAALESAVMEAFKAGEASVEGASEDTIYVNCIPSRGIPRLERYIYRLTEELAEAAGEPDIRMSKKDALSYGKWKGALAAAVKEDPPPGSFTVTCKGDEFADVVVQALEGTHRIIRGF